MARLKTWLMETRPHFLLLTPVCVFTGVSVSRYQGHSLNVLYLVLAFIGALLAHISVNVLNDYFDYKSGIDLKVKRTPFSGGSGMLPLGALDPKSVYRFGIGALTLVVLIGIYFIYHYGMSMLPIGLVGVLLIYLYTPYLTKLPGFTELVGPGAGFGLMVLGTYFTQSGGYSVAAVAVSLVAGLFIANLLLLNEFPDVEADRSAGRKHIPIILGTAGAARVYCSITGLAYLIILSGALAGILPYSALIGLATLPLGVKAMRGALKYHNDIDHLIPYLGTNVIVVLLTPSLMSLGIIGSALIFS
jgi:1,4-dihydroxy-2-naphthoate octaprenyltransferase